VTALRAARRERAEPVREGPTWRDLAACFVRTYLVGGAFNSKGMQNVGLAFAMDPGLVAIYGPGPALDAARERYARHYNTHPFWTPLLTGLFLATERRIARGVFPERVMEEVRETTVYTLSAIGDSLFGGSVMVAWALATIILLLLEQPWAAAGLGATAFAGLQVFKGVTFWLGFREGLSVLHRFKRWNLINWGQRLKLINAGLVVLFWTLAWPVPIVWWQWAGAAGLLGTTAWAVSTAGVSREVVGVLLLAAYLAWPWLAEGARTLLSALE